MKRIGAIVITLFVASSAFAQQAGPRNLSGQGETLEQSQNELQRSVIELYVFNLRNEVGLSEEQFLKAAPVIQRFIRMRFQNANQRKNLFERQEQLLSEPNASDADIQKVNQEVNRLDEETATWNGRMLRNLQAALADRQLSDRQISALQSFNRRFFNEKLPTVLEQMRANNAAVKAQQQQRPNAAGRSNPPNRKDPAAPANGLRGRDVPPVRPNQKIAR